MKYGQENPNVQEDCYCFLKNISPIILYHLSQRKYNAVILTHKNRKVISIRKIIGVRTGAKFLQMLSFFARKNLAKNFFSELRGKNAAKRGRVNMSTTYCRKHEFSLFRIRLSKQCMLLKISLT